MSPFNFCLIKIKCYTLHFFRAQQFPSISYTYQVNCPLNLLAQDPLRDMSGNVPPLRTLRLYCAAVSRTSAAPLRRSCETTAPTLTTECSAVLHTHKTRLKLINTYLSVCKKPSFENGMFMIQSEGTSDLLTSPLGVWYCLDLP